MMYIKSPAVLLIAGLLSICFSCQKNEEYGYSNDLLVLKSQEITLYHFNNGDNSAYTTLVPVKLYARGGAPTPAKGDYIFSVVKGFHLPSGIIMDTLNGVIKADATRGIDESQLQPVLIQVTDGIDTAIATLSFYQKFEKGEKHVPTLQFSAPETSLLCNSNKGYYGVSLSMMAGAPPYTFRLCDGEVLPTGLNLNPQNGVISGCTTNLKSGSYTVKIECTDSKGNKALSMCTSQQYEKFTLIVR